MFAEDGLTFRGNRDSQKEVEERFLRFLGVETGIDGTYSRLPCLQACSRVVTLICEISFRMAFKSLPFDSVYLSDISILSAALLFPQNFYFFENLLLVVLWTRRIAFVCHVDRNQQGMAQKSDKNYIHSIYGWDFLPPEVIFCTVSDCLTCVTCDWFGCLVEVQMLPSRCCAECCFILQPWRRYCAIIIEFGL